MRATNRIILLWICCLVALSFRQAPFRALASTNDTQHNSTKVEHSCTFSDRWSQDNLAQVLNSWKFTPSEESQLLELKTRLADIDHWKNDPAEVARFLKEHTFDVPKAEEMFRAMIQWRKDNNIDTFMQQYGEPPEIFHYSPIFLLKGLDKEGDPIFVQRLGRLDGWGLYRRLGETAMLEANRFVSELHTSRDVGIPEGWRWQREYYEPLTGRRVTQFTILVDLDGLGPRLLRPNLLAFLQRAARIAQDHYPGLAKRIIIVRAPRIFETAWKVAKVFYDPRVHQKFIFTNRDNYLDVLSEYMDLEVLPSVIYPKGNGQQMPGFFEKIHMEGGRLPPLPDETCEEEDPPTQEVAPVTAEVSSTSTSS